MNRRIYSALHSGTALAVLAVLWASLAATTPVVAGEAVTSDPSAHLIRISRQPPPCSSVKGMPVVPNDPGALVTSSGVRCYGTRPAELELWLREDRYVWLERQAANPVAWVKLGPVVVDAAELEPPPLGLRLAESDGDWVLETRYGQTATLTRVDAGSWQEVTSPDGQRFWVRLGPDDRRITAAGDRVRILRAD